MFAQNLNANRSVRILWLIFILLAAGIALAGFFNYRFRENHFKKEMEHKLTAIADLKAGEIVHWRTERLGDARVLFRNPAFAMLVREFFARPRDSVQEKMLRTWMRLVQEGYHYDQVCLLDVRGAVRLSVFDTDEPCSPAVKREAVEALESRQITFVDFYRQERSRKISLALLVPFWMIRMGAGLWDCFS